MQAMKTDIEGANFRADTTGPPGGTVPDGRIIRPTKPLHSKGPVLVESASIQIRGKPPSRQ